MAYKLYQKLKSGMANQGIMDAEDVDVTEGGTRKTLKQKLSTFAPLPDNVTDNKQKVMKNGQWVEVVVPSDASEISYNGDVSGATDVAEAIDALAGDVADAIEASSAVQTAAGTEVGDVAQVEIPAGSIIWHNGQLYEVLALIAPGDHWEYMDVAPTTMSNQINALRGVSTEGVYLTVTPASAIPVEGVKARIYNVTSQTYLPEETITQNYNTVLLGQINYGDVYTIIMPEIEGYTKPADQTFKASQMLRQRTVEYVDASELTSEALVIKATTSNNTAIGDYNATVKLYDGNGNVTQTISVSIEGGISEAVNIPLGTKYSVQYSSISGFVTPDTQFFTGRVPNRTCSGSYISLMTSDVLLVSYDGQEIKYASMDDETAISEAIADGHLFGVAFTNSSLLSNNAAFIYPFDTTVYTKTGYWWSKEANVNAPSANSQWDGRMNSATALDAILQYEIDNSTTITSIFKYADSIVTGFESNGVAIKAFVPSFQQQHEMEGKRTAITTLLYRLGSPVNIEYMASVGCSEQTSLTQYRCTTNNNSSSKNKNVSGTFKLILPLLTSNSIAE